jgi:DNA-binding GntR family transcriptional regulator
MATYTSKTDMVAATLRELIVVGELAPGGPLRQRHLAARLGVSETPIREALRRLESEGLVRFDVHRGATVVEAEQGAIEENYQIRAALESLAASLAAERISDAELAELNELNSRMQATAEDDPQYGELNRRFHFSIYECARSPLLLTLMRLLWQSMPRGPRVQRPHTTSIAQHTALLTALTKHDGDKASHLTRAHILGAAPAANQRRPTKQPEAPAAKRRASPPPAS